MRHFKSSIFIPDITPTLVFCTVSTFLEMEKVQSSSGNKKGKAAVAPLVLEGFS